MWTQINSAISAAVRGTTIPDISIKELIDKVNNINLTAFTTTEIDNIINDILLENDSDYNMLQFMLEFDYYLSMEGVSLQDVEKTWYNNLLVLTTSNLPQELLAAIADANNNEYKVKHMTLLFYMLRMQIRVLNNSYLNKVRTNYKD